MVSKPAAPLVSGPGTGPSKAEDDTAIFSLRHIQVLWSWAARPKTKTLYPPISSIPQTSAARLSEPDVSPDPCPSKPILAKSFHQYARAKPKTVLYLAYGSNMCAETFLGMRGIRPLSQVNVSAPSLDLTFDLPGIPYREPCFANTALRKIPGNPPKLPPDIQNPPFKPPTTQNEVDENEDRLAHRGPVWNKGLYGVVYEVTSEDYAKIVATEGGGASYHDILVPCIVLPPSVRVPEKPTIPVPPRPFLAHTLYAPRLPDLPDDGDDNHGTPHFPNWKKSAKHDGDDDRKKPWPILPRWLRNLFFHRTHRPSPDYAQPSARYLKLLRDGAREHELPADYQAYLGALQPYTATTRRQKLGQVLFLGFWFPIIIGMIMGGRLFADKQGRSPPWLVAISTAVMNMVWLSYDAVGKRLFGDGERTIEEGDAGSMTRTKRRRSSYADVLRGKEEIADEEKRGLLNGYR
ncbi:uncharacterized protein B0T15DRAFT_481311 [Chaetomium strumarium]|uniref:gamma-glutamylcyclotransferase n=1 Tax=Chaetomium strumarium TaxID=1170767 RepID=A0AAJ0H0S0_9PEZI|nr:hypothetical protein B0T15DRAFT_481311 [Chaetomium strumarium]